MWQKVEENENEESVVELMNEYEVYKMQTHLSALPTITVYSHDYTKMRTEVGEGSIFDVFIQKPLKVIKLWGY